MGYIPEFENSVLDGSFNREGMLDSRLGKITENFPSVLERPRNYLNVWGFT